MLARRRFRAFERVTAVGCRPVCTSRTRSRSEVLQTVLPTSVTEAIQEHGLQPLAEPHLHIDDVENVKVNGSQPINLHVHVEVMPEDPGPKVQGDRDRLVGSNRSRMVKLKIL